MDCKPSHAMTTSNTPCQAYVRSYARAALAAAHMVLGVVASFSVWNFTRPCVQHLSPFRRGAGLVMIPLSAFGWGPYLISWVYSRTILKGSRGGVFAFSIGAAGIA